MHLEVDQKYYLWQEEEDGLVHPVLDSLDNYKMLSERMNVLANLSSPAELKFRVDQPGTGISCMHLQYVCINVMC